jgi:hypothetical protein
MSKMALHNDSMNRVLKYKNGIDSQRKDNSLGGVS